MAGSPMVVKGKVRRISVHHPRFVRALVVLALGGGQLTQAQVLTQVNHFVTGFDSFGVPLLIPSIDPAGIAYHGPSGHLFIADSEINEVPEAFNLVGANIFEVSLSGDTLFASYDLTALGNNEPTGITYNVLDGHFYVTNDDARTLSRYSFVAGSGFTLQDEVNTFVSAGSDDPEGITSDPVGQLYVVDGNDGFIVVYSYDFGAGFIVEDVLDLLALNTPATTPLDPEGIAFDEVSGNLFVVSDPDELVFEYTINGIFVQTYDLTGFVPALVGEQGLTFAPTSDSGDDPAQLSLYLADGGIDNDVDPDERDGAIYEASVCDSSASVSVTDPPDGWIVSVGTLVNFNGTSTEGGGGDLSANLIWDSDIDGNLGTGASVSTAGLSVGIHTITASVAAACGTVASDSVNVYVTETASAVGTLWFDVEMAGVGETFLSRCVTIELFDCAGGSQSVDVEVSLASGVASGVEVAIPAGIYTCITARDSRHTLRRTFDNTEGFGVADGRYVASFRDLSPGGGKNWSLVGGDLNGDDFVDIFDFGLFTGQWLTNYGVGDTDCLTTGPHADISGDGLTFTEDFTFIMINFLKASDTPCCQSGAQAGGVSEISVAELYFLGLDELAAGDLNDDGWLNELDMVAFLNGARPPAPRGPGARFGIADHPHAHQ